MALRLGHNFYNFGCDFRYFRNPHVEQTKEVLQQVFCREPKHARPCHKWALDTVDFAWHA